MIKLEPIKKKYKELMQIAKWRNETLQTLRSTSPTEVDYDKQCRWVDKIIDDKYFYIYNELGQFIGYCGLDKINETNKTAELSLLIGQPFQKKGYGKETVKKLLKYAFNELHLNCIFIEVYTTENNWLNFWEKLGFKLEGIHLDRKYWQDCFYNSITASILKKEFLMQEKE